MTKEQIKDLAKEFVKKKNEYNSLCRAKDEKLEENIKWLVDVESKLNEEELKDFYWFMADEWTGEKIFEE